MTEYALPSPPNVFGLDGVTVGRTVGLLASLAGTMLTHTALKSLGDQYHAIGVSALFSMDYRIPAGGLHSFWAIDKEKTQAR
jgi:hypothetical protein